MSEEVEQAIEVLHIMILYYCFHHVLKSTKLVQVKMLRKESYSSLAIFFSLLFRIRIFFASLMAILANVNQN